LGAKVDDVMPNDPIPGPVEIPNLKENYLKRCMAMHDRTSFCRPFSKDPLV
jgi:hypothetical protein